MCEQDIEATQVKLAHPRSDGRTHVPVDPCIAPIVQALNDAGIATVASCCGHGKRPGGIILADGRELLLAENFEQAREVDRAFPPINGEPRKIEVDIGAAMATLQANPELAAQMTELVGGPALVEAQAEVERLRLVLSKIVADAEREGSRMVFSESGDRWEDYIEVPKTHIEEAAALLTN